jgi:hypothetical protein
LRLTGLLRKPGRAWRDGRSKFTKKALDPMDFANFAPRGKAYRTASPAFLPVGRRFVE